MSGWNFNGTYNILTTPRGITAKLPTLVMEHVVVNELYIAVLYSVPSKSISENVVAFNESGKMVWQIEKCQEISNNYGCFYEKIDRGFSEDGVIKIQSWNHYDAYVDIATGKIKELVNIVPGWKVGGNLIVCPNQAQVKMPSDIKRYDLILGNLLVLVQQYRGGGAENIFYISPTGQILWQVSPVSEVAGSGVDVYIDYSELLEDKKSLRLFSFGGAVNVIDINTGKSLHVYFTK